MIMTIKKDALFLSVAEDIEKFRKRLSERKEKMRQKQKECKVRSDIESKMQQELKIKAELSAQLAKLTDKTSEIEKICSNFKSGVTISERDKTRLENAKEMVEIGKELTSVRFDYSAPDNQVKGYIKCAQRRLLCPFSFKRDNADDEIWAFLNDAYADVENQPYYFCGPKFEPRSKTTEGSESITTTEALKSNDDSNK